MAEGIETLDQLNQMKLLGCSCFQGFYFSEAVAKKNINKVIEAIDQRNLLDNLNKNNNYNQKLKKHGCLETAELDKLQNFKSQTNH